MSPAVVARNEGIPEGCHSSYKGREEREQGIEIVNVHGDRSMKRLRTLTRFGAKI